MNRDKSHIDEMLWSSLDNAETDAPGAGWDGFQQYKNRRKRRTLFFWMVPVIFISIGISAFLLSGLWQSASLVKSEKIQSAYPEQNTGQGLPLRPQKTEEVKVSDDKNTGTDPVEPMEEVLKLVQAGLSSSNQASPYKGSQGSLVPPDENFEGPILPDFGQIPSLPLVAIGEHGMDTIFDDLAVELKSPEQKDSGHSEKNSGKWHIQIQEGFVYSFPQFELQNAGTNYVHKDYPGIRKRGENGLTGFGFRFTVGREIGKFSVSTGFGITYQKVLGDYDYVYSETPLIDVDNKIFGYGDRTPTRIQFGSDQSYFFTEIPIGLEWSPFSQTQKIKKSIYLNYVNQFLMGVKGDLPNALMLDQVDQMSIANFNYYSSSFEFGFNFAYPLNHKNDLLISPRYRWNAGLNQIQGYYDTRLSYIGVHFMWRTQF